MNEILRNEPGMDYNVQFSSSFALYECILVKSVGGGRDDTTKSIRCITQVLLYLWCSSYYYRYSTLFVALVLLPIFFSVYTDRNVHILFLPKIFPKIKYLGTRLMYLYSSLDNFTTMYLHSLLRIYRLIKKLFALSV